MSLASETGRIPQLPGHWLSGNLNDYRADRLEFYCRLRSQLGDFAGFRLGPKRMVLITQPDALREIFVTRNREFGRSFSTKMLSQFFGDGLLISEGARWLNDRRLIQPSFTRERIVGFVATFAARVRLRLLPGQRIRPHASVTIRPSPAVNIEVQTRKPGALVDG